MPVNTGYLSELTTDFTSNVSIRGRVTWHSAISSPLLASFGTVRVGAGSAIMPSLAFNSEASLGLYRSGTSTIAMSYGQLRVDDGGALLPSVGFESETSLGLYRSVASAIALSYGVLDLRTGSVKLSWDTRASVSGLTLGELALVYQASGLSFIYSSGRTAWAFGSTSSAAIA